MGSRLLREGMEAGSVVDVLIVDDQALFRAVARTVVSMVPGWQVVGEADSGRTPWRSSSSCGLALC